MGMIPAGLTEDELAAHAKGYGRQFDGYVDIDAPILISPANYAQIVTWCEPYMARRHEVQGCVVFHFVPGQMFEEAAIERVYVMGGNSASLRTTVLMDSDEMLRQIQRDYSEIEQFMSNRVGWWHLHPGYYPGLSVGDVEECRTMLRAIGATDTKVLHLLMYGDPRGGWQLSGYLIGIEEVYRLPVRIHF